MNSLANYKNSTLNVNEAVIKTRNEEAARRVDPQYRTQKHERTRIIDYFWRRQVYKNVWR